MLDGWYCRSMANNANTTEEEDDDESIKYKSQYKNLKRKLKFLIYENESFQDTLKSAQRRLLTVSKDRSFLLDRLLQYERVDPSSSESEDTESSDDPEMAKVEVKKRKSESVSVNHGNGVHAVSSGKGQTSAKRKRPAAPKQIKQPVTQSPMQLHTMHTIPTNMISDGHMTPEEVERHLQSRQSYMELVPEKAPPTVPTEMFSNDPSLDSESNDIGELETSPSNMGEDLSIDMIVE